MIQNEIIRTRWQNTKTQLLITTNDSTLIVQLYQTMALPHSINNQLLNISRMLSNIYQVNQGKNFPLWDPLQNEIGKYFVLKELNWKNCLPDCLQNTFEERSEKFGWILSVFDWNLVLDCWTRNTISLWLESKSLLIVIMLDAQSQDNNKQDFLSTWTILWSIGIWRNRRRWKPHLLEANSWFNEHKTYNNIESH